MFQFCMEQQWAVTRQVEVSGTQTVSQRNCDRFSSVAVSPGLCVGPGKTISWKQHLKRSGSEANPRRSIFIFHFKNLRTNFFLYPVSPPPPLPTRGFAVGTSNKMAPNQRISTNPPKIRSCGAGCHFAVVPCRCHPRGAVWRYLRQWYGLEAGLYNRTPWDEPPT